MKTKRLVNLAILAGAASSNNKIKGRSYYGYLTSELSKNFFFKMIDKLEVNFMLECGANAAETSQSFVLIPGRKSVAIEANPNTYDDVTSKINNKNIQTICAALSDEIGETQISVPISEDSTNGASSLLKRNDETKYDTYEVKKTTIDNIIDEEIEYDKYSKVAIWMDVEGYAYQALLGAKKTLLNENIPLIYVEVETEKFWSEQRLASDIDDYLKELDYTPVIRDIQSKNQFNLIYIRNDYLDECDELIIKYWEEFGAIKNNYLIIIRSWIRQFINNLTNK